MLSLLKKFGSLKVHHKILFAIIAGIGGVLFWRGAWGLLDLSFDAAFGAGTPLNYVSCLVIGIALLLGTGALLHAMAVE